MASVRSLRETLGDDGMVGLHTFVDDAGRQWKDDVLLLAGERFERRLAQEVGALRTDMAKEFAAVRVEMAQQFAAMRIEILKWSFLFWIGQFAAITGTMAFLLRTLGSR
jgi:hypothetical protein